MTLHPQVAFVIPTETIRIAQAAFPQPSIYMRMRDELGPIYSDQSFAPLFASCGQPALSPARLAPVTVMQRLNLCEQRIGELENNHVGLRLGDHPFLHTAGVRRLLSWR